MNAKTSKPKVKLVGNNGNAFAIMGACFAAARKADWSKAQIDAVKVKMISGGYDNLLAVACEHFDVR